MSDNEKSDYSDYIKHLSNMGNMYAFVSGFMFTAITLVVTRLPDPSTTMAQSVLFFMGIMLNIFIYYMGAFYFNVVELCKNRPSYSGKTSLFNIVSDLSIMIGLGGSIILLFLLWGLTYLALAQTIVWIVFSVVAYRAYFKPFYREHKLAL